MIGTDKSGMGDVNQTATGVGGTLGTGLLTAGAIAGGPTNPVGIGLMIAGGAVMLGSALLGVFGVGKRNPYEDKDVATLNGLEVQLQSINQQWQASNKDSVSQQQALAAVDYLLAQLQQLCADPNLGTNWAAGCIGDRKPGGKYDWWKLYRDPIANATVSDAGVGNSLVSLVGGSNVVYVAGGLMVLGLILANKE